MKKINLLLITLTFIFMFSFNCFAADLPSPPGAYTYYHIIKINKNPDLGLPFDRYLLYEYPVNYVMNSENYYAGTGSYKFYQFNANGTDTSWVLQQELTDADIRLPYKYSFGPDPCPVIYTNHVISDEAGNTVFQKAPMTLVSTSTLLQVMSQIRYLIPSLILCLVVLIAFYKAWHWLKTQLSIWGKA